MSKLGISLTVVLVSRNSALTTALWHTKAAKLNNSTANLRLCRVSLLLAYSNPARALPNDVIGGRCAICKQLGGDDPDREIRLETKAFRTLR